MATTVKEVVTVDELSKFGFKSEGVYYNWSKKCPDDQKASVVPGRKFEMEIYVADSGKKYCNKILQPVPGIADSKPVPLPRLAPPSPSADAPMTRSDWEAKDQRISRAGVIQAAVRAVGPVVPIEEIFPTAKALAEQMLAFVNEK